MIPILLLFGLIPTVIAVLRKSKMSIVILAMNSASLVVGVYSSMPLAGVIIWLVALCLAIVGRPNIRI